MTTYPNKAKKATKKVAKRSAASNPALEAFKQMVVDTVMNYPDGCAQGRRDFLEGLGLEYPAIKRSFTVELTLDADNDLIDESDIRSAIGRYIEYYNLIVTEEDV